MCKHVALFYILIRQTTAISMPLMDHLFSTAINLLKGNNKVPMIIPYMVCVQQKLSHTPLTYFVFKYWIFMTNFQDNLQSVCPIHLYSSYKILFTIKYNKIKDVQMTYDLYNVSITLKFINRHFLQNISRVPP